MPAAADSLDFERAAALRDRIDQLQASMGEKVSDVAPRPVKETRKRGKHKGKGASRVPRPKRK